jgi:hypothetical protein
MAAYEQFMRKVSHGQVVYVQISTEPDQGASAQFKAFHAYRDEYAALAGLDNEYAKAELKAMYGVAYRWGPGFEPPSRSGRFVEIHGEMQFLVSTLEYTDDELSRLIQGTQYLISELEGNMDAEDERLLSDESDL